MRRQYHQPCSRMIRGGHSFEEGLSEDTSSPVRQKRFLWECFYANGVYDSLRGIQAPNTGNQRASCVQQWEAYGAG